jgi:hypothetical protein
MALDKTQLMDPPGGPGSIGGVTAGSYVSISADGTISTTGGGYINGVFEVQAGTGISVTPDPGINNVIIDFTGVAPDPPFRSGTRMVICNSSAPSGWRTVTSYNNYALRLSSGSGGGTGGSMDFTSTYRNVGFSGSTNSGSGGNVSGDTQSGTWNPTGTVDLTQLFLSGASLTESTNGAHDHGFSGGKNGLGSASLNNGCAIDIYTYIQWVPTGSSQAHSHNGSGLGSMDWTGDPKPHTHSFNSQIRVDSGSWSGGDADLNVRYIDAIIVEKP